MFPEYYANRISKTGFYLDLMNIDPLSIIYNESILGSPLELIDQNYKEYSDNYIYIKIPGIGCINPATYDNNTYESCTNYRMYVTDFYVIGSCFPEDFDEKYVTLYYDSQCSNEINESNRNIEYERSVMNPDKPRLFHKCTGIARDCLEYDRVLLITKYFQLYFYENHSTVWTDLSQYNLYGWTDNLIYRTYADFAQCVDSSIYSSILMVKNSLSIFYGNLNIGYNSNNFIGPLSIMYTINYKDFHQNIPELQYNTVMDRTPKLEEYMIDSDFSVFSRVISYLLILCMPYFYSGHFLFGEIAATFGGLLIFYWIIPVIVIIYNAYNNKYISMSNYSNFYYLECSVSWILYYFQNYNIIKQNPSLYSGLWRKYDFVKLVVCLFTYFFGFVLITFLIMSIDINYAYLSVWIILIGYNTFCAIYAIKNYLNNKPIFITGPILKMEILDNSIEIKDFEMEKFNNLREMVTNLNSSYNDNSNTHKNLKQLIQEYDQIQMYSANNVCYDIDSDSITKSYMSSYSKTDYFIMNKKLVDRSIISYTFNKYKSIKENMYNSSIDLYQEIKLDNLGLEIYNQIPNSVCDWNYMLKYFFSPEEITSFKMMSPKASYIFGVNDDIDNALIVDEFLNPIINKCFEETFESISKFIKVSLSFTGSPIKLKPRSLEKLKEYYFEVNQKYQEYLETSYENWYSIVDSKIRTKGCIDIDEDSILSKLKTPIILNLKDKTRGSIIFDSGIDGNKIEQIHDTLVNLDKHLITDDDNLQIKYWYHKNMYNNEKIEYETNSKKGIFNHFYNNWNSLDMLVFVVLILLVNPIYVIGGQVYPKIGHWYLLIRIIYIIVSYCLIKKEEKSEELINLYKDIKYYYLIKYKNKKTIYELQLIDSKMIEYKKKVHKYYSKVRNRDWDKMQFKLE